MGVRLKALYLFFLKLFFKLPPLFTLWLESGLTENAGLCLDLLERLILSLIFNLVCSILPFGYLGMKGFGGKLASWALWECWGVSCGCVGNRV